MGMDIRIYKHALGAMCLGVFSSLAGCAPYEQPATNSTDAPVSPGQITFEGVGVSEGVFETDSVGPSAFYVDEYGTAYLVDRVNERLLLASRGSEQRSISLTELLGNPASEVLDLEVVGDQLIFLTTDGVQSVRSPIADSSEIVFESGGNEDAVSLAEAAFARSGYSSGLGARDRGDIRFESTGAQCDGRRWSEISALAWRDTARSARGGHAFEIEMQRKDEDVIVVRIRDDGGSVWADAAPIQVNGIISTAQAAGADRNGNVYVLVESVRDGGKIAVAASVFKYVLREGPSPIFVPVVRFDVPLKRYRTLPARYVRVNSNGEVWISRYNADGTQWVEEAPAQAIFSAAEYAESTDPNAKLPANFLALTQPDDAVFFESSSRATTTREEILQRAESILNMEWTFDNANARPPSGNDALCRKRRGSAWIAPARLRGKTAGDTISSMPYRWGGWDSVDGFKIATTKAAGDTCTCRSSSLDYCVVPGSKGIDCSGFITRTWYESPRRKYGTSTLNEISSEKDWRDLQCGDILNRSGRHVRLFSRFLPDYGGMIEFYESSLDCGGVCKRYAPMATFRSYIAREFNHIEDGEIDDGSSDEFRLE